MHDLWKGAWLAAMIVGVLVWGLIFYACVKFYRRRDDEIPVQTRYNLPIEILYTVAPVVMVLVFFFFTVTARTKCSPSKGGEADHTVTVVGQQWSWTFNYDEDPALDGVDHASTTAARPPTGPRCTSRSDESSTSSCRSPDVIHSFWVPAFLFKMDVVPGRDNALHLHPDAEGTFDGKCAELCGTYHSRMLFNVKVVSADEYASAPAASSQEQGNIGPALGGSEADTQAGLETATRRRRRVSATAEGAKFQATATTAAATPWASRSSGSSRPPTTS